jgi:hypothetical protein
LDERGGLGAGAPPTVYLVNEEQDNDVDLESLDEDMRVIEEEEKYTKHDVHQCASATCPVYREYRATQPTFLSMDSEHEMRQQLGPTQPNNDRFFTPDTVEL